jgi:membrane protein
MTTYFATGVRAAKRMLADNMLMIASALAYSTFFAIPSVLLVVVGLFTLFSGQSTINTVINHIGRVMPQQATNLLHDSIARLNQHPSTSVAITIVGFVLAFWSLSGAMSAYMTAINLAYEQKDRRSFLKKRAVALVLIVCAGVAFLLVAGLLIFGPTIESAIGNATGNPAALKWVWWTAQWPILIVALLFVFATMLALGPDLPDRSWRFFTPGSAIAVVIWLLVSGAFAYYTSKFGSYNKAWGSLAAVIIMLTWLWLTALALLYGAEFNAELERRDARGSEPSPGTRS